MSAPKRGIGAYQPGEGMPGGVALGENYLLVIGIDQYLHFPNLNNAVRDARTFATLLQERYQFDARNTETLFNEEATERQLLFKLRDLARLITPQDNLIVYFSGHGEFDPVLQEGYWIPVDAERDALEDYIPNSKIHTVLNAIRSRHTFLIIDSCFSGSLFMQYRTGAGGDRLETLPSRWGLTSGRNEVVPDGPAGLHSPFAESLLNQLRLNQDALGVGELCQRVVESVAARSGQIPRGEPLRVQGHEGGQFFFRIREPKSVSDHFPQGHSSGPSKGGLLYSIPGVMEVGQESRCEVRIAFDKTVLFQDFDTRKQHEIRDIRISNLMEVALLDPQQAGEEAFSVRTLSTAEQFVDPDDYTQWIFYVKALKEGVYPLMLKVTVIEVIEGRERRKEIVLEENVEVRTHVSEMPESRGYTSAYSFSLADPVYPESEMRPPPPAPAIEPMPSIPQVKTRRQGWIRMAAGLVVILIAALFVIRLSIQPSSLDAERDYKLVEAPLAEARELLEKEEVDIPRAEELLETARRSSRELEQVPEPILKEIQKVEVLLEEKRRRIPPPEPGQGMEQPEKEPAERVNPERLADRTQPGKKSPEARPAEVFTDQRDGRRYPSLIVEGKHWLQRNMAYETDGMACYADRPVMCENLGGLYSWEAARRACPPGWHLPKVGEWDALVNAWGGYEKERAFMALGYGGPSFFQAQLAGGQNERGGFTKLHEAGAFWTANPDGEKEAIAIIFDKNTQTIRKEPMSRNAKFSCRCVRD